MIVVYIEIENNNTVLRLVAIMAQLTVQPYTLVWLPCLTAKTSLALTLAWQFCKKAHAQTKSLVLLKAPVKRRLSGNKSGFAHAHVGNFQAI